MITLSYVQLSALIVFSVIFGGLCALVGLVLVERDMNRLPPRQS